MISIQKSVKEFLRHCKNEKKLSNKTIKAYTTDLTQLIAFLKKQKYSLHLKKISKNELRDFFESLRELKPKSIKRKIATLKAMFTFMEFEEHIESNPFRKLKLQIKEPRKLPNVMNIQEVNSIFQVVYKRRKPDFNSNSYSHFESIRNIAIIELLFATGARVSEIADLKKENINLETGLINIRGKGDKERIIQICHPETLYILKEYFLIWKNFTPSYMGFFLINRLGKKLSDQSIRNLVKALTLKAGVQRKITPHTFRHTFATLLLENDVDIKYISSLLGHSSIMTTQIYTYVNSQKQKQILITKHPRNSFSTNNFSYLNAG